MSELVMPNQIKVENDATFKGRVQRFKAHRSQFGDTSIFQLNDVNYVVGREADVSNRNRITGPMKYRKGALDVMLISALLKYFPDGHNNIIVGCAHTTDSVPYVEHIANAIRGKHEIVRYDGERVQYTVRGMIPWDEPAGGLFRFLTRPYAEYNAEDIMPDERIMVVDIGGKISSMVPAVMLSGQQVEIQWGEGHAFDMGIQDILFLLEAELKSLYPDTFRVRTIPPTILQEALRRDGFTRVHTTDVDVKQAVLNATAPLLNQIENTWSTQMDQMLDVRHIIVTGGGGGLLFRVLKDDIFHMFPNAVYMAEDPACIHLANLRGGKHAVSVWVAENGSKVKTQGTTKPAYMVIDPGNSAIKSTVIE